MLQSWDSLFLNSSLQLSEGKNLYIRLSTTPLFSQDVSDSFSSCSPPPVECDHTFKFPLELIASVCLCACVLFFWSYCLFRLLSLDWFGRGHLNVTCSLGSTKQWVPTPPWRVEVGGRAGGLVSSPQPWLGSISGVIKVGPTYATPHWLQWLKRHLRSRTRQTSRPR